MRTALRLGAHQLLAMRVPAHAAVGATVGPGPARPRQGTAGFVNAVLRRVGERDLEAWLAELAPPLTADPLGHLAMRSLAPALDRRGARPRARRATSSRELPRPLSSAVDAAVADVHPGRPLLGPVAPTPAELLAAGGAEPGRWSPYAVTLAGGGSPADIPRCARAGPGSRTRAASSSRAAR